MIDIGYFSGPDLVRGLGVRTAGHIFARAGRRIDRPAGRQDWLLFYVTAGSETFFLPEGTRTAEPGDLVLFAPGQPQQHVCRHRGTAEFYYVHFVAEGDAAARLEFPATSALIRRPGGRSLAGLFQQILEELQQARPYCHELAAGLLEQIFLHLRRDRAEQTGAAGALPDRMSRILHEIHKTWREPLTLEQYAARFSLSKYHFSRMFREATGMSPIRYRNRLRLRWAAEMLEETGDPVADIAAESGFDSARSFSEAFRAAYGQSPSEYRKSRR